MSAEKKEGFFSGMRESIFAKPLEQKGMFETAAPAAAEDEARPAAVPTKNPFSTGTDAPAPPPAQPEAPAAAQAPVSADQDARVIIETDVGGLVAEAIVTAPNGSGAGLSKEMLSEALGQAGIVFGLREKGLAELLKPSYGERIVVARGVPPKDGEDGFCKEHYPRAASSSVKEQADGTVNYKELGLINDLKAGTVVCEIFPPSDGIPGTSVFGKPLKPRNGKKAIPPVSETIRLSDDGKTAVTTIDGNLVFRNGHFMVDTVYRVQDIDYDVGNITFSGDVQVNGDMLDGFEIHSGGNITLSGRVGNVVLEAKKDILIEHGINGTGKAEIITEGNVKAGFIENCTVRAGGDILSGSIINSQVECEGDIDVTTKHGIICGGKVTAFGSVKANVVGNESSTPTQVLLGITPNLLKERKRLIDQLADVGRHIEEMEKNTVYIEKMLEQKREVPQDRIQLLQRTKLTLPMTEKKRDQLKSSIAEIERKMASANDSTLCAKVLYPPTRISIGIISITCSELRRNTRVYKNQEGDLAFGTYS